MQFKMNTKRVFRQSADNREMSFRIENLKNSNNGFKK